MLVLAGLFALPAFGAKDKVTYTDRLECGVYELIGRFKAASSGVESVRRAYA